MNSPFRWFNVLPIATSVLIGPVTNLAVTEVDAGVVSVDQALLGLAASPQAHIDSDICTPGDLIKVSQQGGTGYNYPLGTWRLD